MPSLVSSATSASSASRRRCPNLRAAACDDGRDVVHGRRRRETELRDEVLAAVADAADRFVRIPREAREGVVDGLDARRSPIHVVRADHHRIGAGRRPHSTRRPCPRSSSGCPPRGRSRRPPRRRRGRIGRRRLPWQRFGFVRRAVLLAVLLLILGTVRREQDGMSSVVGEALAPVKPPTQLMQAPAPFSAAARLSLAASAATQSTLSIHGSASAGRPERLTDVTATPFAASAFVTACR